ncbi:MAG: acetolactate synthase large subunit [bacterium]|nr:acetolactate synthase large subunit [bacterium]
MGNGAEELIRTAHASGVDTCFANPGTTEMHLVGALDAVSGMRSVLGLFEGVITGAADGYGRMTDRPALTVLHLGPGFANGIANLHNACRAHTPVVNLVGDQATWHLSADAPLTSDIHSLANPVSNWVRTSKSARELPGDGATAIAEATSVPGSVSTLIIPADCAWEEAPEAARPIAPTPARAVASSSIDAVASALRGGESVLLLLGGRALREPGLRAAARIASGNGARVLMDTFPARVERGAGLPFVDKLPYFPEQIIALLKTVSHLVLVETLAPVSFFAYPGVPSRLAPDGCTVHTLAEPDQDGAGALEALADALAAPKASVPDATLPALPSGALTPDSLGAALACLQPENAIVMDESATSGRGHLLASAASPPHTMLSLTGGAIGQGLPCATGAAVACPDRTVIALQADGSGMYTLQSLWTQAREGLDVKTIICANREYRILKIELARADIVKPGPAATALTNLAQPVIDWVSLARGMGVPGESAETAEELISALGRAFATPGPYLIEAVI